MDKFKKMNELRNKKAADKKKQRKEVGKGLTETRVQAKLNEQANRTMNV